jgi:hypothetical protein
VGSKCVDNILNVNQEIRVSLMGSIHPLAYGSYPFYVFNYVEVPNACIPIEYKEMEINDVSWEECTAFCSQHQYSCFAFEYNIYKRCTTFTNSDPTGCTDRISNS